MGYYLRNCFWLMVPSFLLLFLAADRLPASFQPGTFWHDIPWFISWPENLLRTLFFALTALMPFSLATQRQRRGLAVYLLGTVLYIGSWLVLIVAPQSGWSQSAAGFLAPAYTPLIWLFGIGMIHDRLFWPTTRYRPWMFFAVVVAALGFHIAHAAMVYGRLP